MNNTSLHKSPFALLEITIRDNATRIVEQAEEKSLFLDSDVCVKARNDLTVARNRLTSEISWLPGVAPNRASALMESLTQEVSHIVDEMTLPSLAHANLIAAAFESLDPAMDAKEWVRWIIAFAQTSESIDAKDVLREINIDRSVSGFPEIKGIDQIESDLEGRRRYFTETIRTSINKLSPLKLVKVVTDAVDSTTNLGGQHAPQLIHDLVERYEIESNKFLQTEAENILKLSDTIKNSAVNGLSAIQPLVDKLDQMVRKWDAIAQPIQLSMKAQGLDHQLSLDVAYGVRSLSIDLFNDHDMASTSARLNKTLQDLFAEVPKVIGRIEEDAVTMDRITTTASARKVERNQEITYQADIGLLTKDTVRISPDGVEWRGQTIPLEEINRVRWGAVSHSINGFPTGTTYTVVVIGNNSQNLTIETRKKEIYDALTDRLWKAVCVRLIGEYLTGLKSGKKPKIGTVEFDDYGVTLTKHKFWGNELVYVKWADVSQYSYNGALHLKSRLDSQVYDELSYLNVSNTHILETILRVSFKSWKGRLSDMLES